MNTTRERRGDDDVLVVGAGPVGLAVACDLLVQGIDVRVIERAARGTVHSRAVVVWPRSLELLRRIGVVDHLVAGGGRLDAVSYYSGERRLASLSMTELEETPYPFALCTPQHRTEDVLRRRLAQLGGTVEHGIELTDVDGSGARPVAVLRRDDGSREVVRPGWLIGADGAHSAVRRGLGVEFRGDGQDLSFAIADAPLAGELPPNEMLYCYRAGGAVGMAPFGDGTYRVACAAPEGAAPTRQLLQRNLDLVTPFRARIGSLGWTTVFRARRRTAATFRQGRCFLVGDAAHVFSAAGSQGMNTGFQDAAGLAWRLGGVLRGTLAAGVLDTYDPERRHAAERVSRVSAHQTALGLMTGRVAVPARDHLVRAAARTGLVQRVVTPLMSQLSVNYAAERDGAAADVRWRPGRVRIGERLPVLAAPGGGGVPGWPCTAPGRLSVLLWGGSSPGAAWDDLAARVRAVVPGSVDVLDVSGGPAPRRRLGDRPVAVVVRPDGHVAALHRPPCPEAVHRSLVDAGARVGTGPAAHDGDRVPATL